MHDVAAERLSDLIGSIYDCTIEPDRWPDTMKEICGELDCMHAAILLVDLIQSQHVFFQTWNIDPYWIEKNKDFYEETTMFYRNSARALAAPVDDVLVISRDLAPKIFFGSRYYREWIKPQGICDTIQTVVLRQPDRIGVFAPVRHESVGVVTDREIAIMRLLAPHIRRAVTIGDVIDLKALEAQALAATLDKVAAGVTVVGEDRRILHATAAARGMFAAGGPIGSVQGRLVARDPRARQELDRAVALARQDESALGAAGIGIALGAADDAAAVAHVLPLARGDLRTRLIPQATAAVFVTAAASPPQRDLAPIARSYGLTPAETRLLECLTSGATVAEAAALRGVALSTAKTHLAHIFSKTGTTRQADLVDLIHRLTPPVR
ncbi:MAG TPA: helix-turn-helix transcriptional regulator [Stellaceae bacterium]|nr:helix-turn-helix transcriptional regulator [Stellaceae bacterium]